MRFFSFDKHGHRRDHALRHWAVITMLAVPPVWAQPAVPLSLDEAVHRAGTQSRLVAAATYEARAAREMAVAAGQRPDPSLKAGINNLPVAGAERFSLTRDFMTMRSIGIGQEFTRSDKRQARTARYEREAEAADTGRLLAMADAQQQAAIAWLDRHYQQHMFDLLMSQRDEAALQVEAADLAYRNARGAQADVFAARAAAAQIEDRIAQVRRQVVTAQTLLERWVGVAATRPLADAPPMDEVRLKPADLEARLAHHPQIAMMARQEEVAQADAEIARTGKRSDWSAELMFSQRGPAYSNMVSLNLSIPLQWDRKNRQDRELLAKLALADQVRARREEATRTHVVEALAMLQEWQGNRDRLKRYDTTLIPLAADRARAAATAYRAGTGSLTGALEARRAEIDTRTDRLRLEMETARLWARLNYLIPVDHESAETPR